MTAPRREYRLDPKYRKYPTIVHALAAAAGDAPGAPAMRCEEVELTYGQYARAVAAMAARFAAVGVKGGRIAFMTPNSLEAAIGLLGGMAAGAQVSPVNPNYTDRELAPILKDIDACLLAAAPSVAARAEALAGQAGIANVLVLGTGDVAALLGAPESEMPLPANDDYSAMFFTGGTTGVPKGAPHTHKSLMAYCHGVATYVPFGIGEERILNVAPLFHVWGFCFSLVFPVYIRAFLDLMPAYKPALVLEEFQRRSISVFAGGPAALYMGLRANENYKTTDYSSLKICMSGGAACPEELHRDWKAVTGAVILEGLGMSEGAPVAQTPLHGIHKPGSVGLPPPDTEVDIVDLETGTKIQPQGGRGEIRVKGDQFITGYRNRPEENQRQIRDGYLYTGDIGYFDTDGYLWVVDRKKEMIIVGGYNVYPREVDELLFAHPAILEAATVGVPDSFSGEAVKAFVVLKPGAALAEEELLEYCRESLVKYKVPTHVEFLPDLPKTGVGKIDKLALKAAG
jgi:long-chain acyl-CoA synthetase